MLEESAGKRIKCHLAKSLTGQRREADDPATAFLSDGFSIYKAIQVISSDPCLLESGTVPEASISHLV